MVPPVRGEVASQVIPLFYQKLQSHNNHYLGSLTLLVVDYVAIILALLSAWQLRSTILPYFFPELPPFHISGNYIFAVIPITFLLFLLFEGMYTRRLPFWQSAEIIFRICTYVTILAVWILYFLKSGHVSRIFLTMAWLLSFIFLSCSRFYAKRILANIGLWQKPVIIIGAGKTAEMLAKSFAEEPNLGYKIYGLIEDNVGERPLLTKYPYLGSFMDAEAAVVQSGIQDIIIAAPGLDHNKLLQLVFRLQPHVKNLVIVPNLIGLPIGNLEAETIFNEKAILLRVRNNMKAWYNKVFKRMLDLFGSVVGGICIIPILLFISIAIYVSSPGPIIFAHQRVGRKGEFFSCYKFRSMITNSQEVLAQYLAINPEAREEWEKDFKLKNDPRITKVGKFLRKTSLDELPQLLNVLKGEMSLVGPRPIVEKEVEKYGEYINDYYLVRPGMTGYWQVSGRNDVDYDTRVQMDSWYVRNWSFWMDIVMLIKTVNVVLGRKGAY